MEKLKIFKKNIKPLIYTACGVGLCWIDLWRGIGNGAQWALAVNCIGFCIFPMIVLRLDWRMLLPKYKVTEKWQNAFRIIFYLWVIAFIICAYPVFKYFAPGTDYDAQIATAVANAGLYGAVAIRMYFYLFFEKNYSESQKSAIKNPVFLLWLAFMVLAIISVNKFIWPLWFLVMFGALYLAPVKKSETEEIIVGLANGLIIGFFWIQGRAFLYRPYDCGPRYYGHYTNPNVNAMFYLFTYVAWLTKLTYYRVKKAPKRYAFTFLMASSMWVFEFFTGCRSAWLAFAAVTIVYWCIETKNASKRLKNFVGKFALMALLALVTFFPVYACMRYIPPLRHHPIWYQGEYSEDRIMAWDPIDSPKYESLDSILYYNLGRLAFFAKNITEDEKEIVEVTELQEICEHTIVYAADGETVHSYSCGKEPGSDSLHPLYIEINYEKNILSKALGIRYYIFRYIIGKVRLFGNEEPYFVVWFLDILPLGHAHNSVLMITYWFGVFTGISFVILMVIACLQSVNKKKGNNDSEKEIVPAIFALITMVAFILSGLTECTVFLGEMPFSLFFIALFPLICQRFIKTSTID